MEESIHVPRVIGDGGKERRRETRFVDAVLGRHASTEYDWNTAGAFHRQHSGRLRAWTHGRKWRRDASTVWAERCNAGRVCLIEANRHVDGTVPVGVCRQRNG